MLFDTLQDHHLYHKLKCYAQTEEADAQESLFKSVLFRNMCVEVRNKHPDLIKETSHEQSVIEFSDFMTSDQLINEVNDRYQSMRLKPKLP